jgi:biopolymer transport protein ExbB
MFDALISWWRGGDFFMPLMLGVALVLYTLLAERTCVLLSLRRSERRDELLDILRKNHHGEHAEQWRTWAAQYVGLAEALELSRGFMVIRALTASLPLLGLFGTVTGMVDTFAQLGAAGVHQTFVTQHASGGIGLALTATQYGIALAVPAMLWEWLLSRRVAQLTHHREMVVRDALQNDPDELPVGSTR